MPAINDAFRKLAHRASEVFGSPWAFTIAVVIVLGWALTGPLFGFSETWQLVINTGTTIVTFLMVFLIQNTQNRDMRALHLKLDELLRGVEGARNSLIDLECLSDEELARLETDFHELHLRGDHDAAERRDAIRKERGDREAAASARAPD